MTLVVGLIADDGLVIASDSQISAGAYRRPSQKVWAVQDGSFAFGVAGSEATMHALRDALTVLNLTGGTRTQISELLTSTLFAVLQPIYERARGLGVPTEAFPIGEFVVGAWSGDAPLLFHGSSLGEVTYHDRGFVSAGSGGPFAEHSITVNRHLRTGPMSLHQAKMLAFRVVQDAIEAAGPTLAIGGKIQMATVSRDGPGACCELLGEDDPETVFAVDSWREFESEMFRDHQPPG